MQTCYEVITDSHSSTVAVKLLKKLSPTKESENIIYVTYLMLYFIFYEQVHNGEIFPIIILLGRQFTTISGSGKRTEPLNVSILI